MSSHTPGPWAHGFHDGSGQAGSEGGGWILAGEHAAIEKPAIVVSGGIDGWGVHQGVMRPEDARLIATAPELLSLLQGWVDSFADCIEGGEADPMVAATRAAIAKATGGSDD